MKRKTHFLCSVVLILATAARAHGDDVDDFVKKIMQQRHIPAISIAVVKDGVVVKTAGYGLANMEHNVPARPDTVYKIGSTSKQFIASGIMLLVQDGKIAVDDKVSKYLDGTPASWQDITVRRLLTHTSGLAREGPAFDPYKVQPDINVIKSAYSVALLFKPGDRYEYSNLGYFTLAEIIHRVSGKPWDQFINERIFAPLGMTATRATNFFDIVANRADGYVWEMDRFTNAEHWTTVRPSGAFLSTATDMAKWEAALQSDRILKASTKAEMWTPVMLNNGEKYPYGFGWELDDFPPGNFGGDVPSIRHEGSIPGFRAAFTRFPKQNLSVIVLSNLNGAALDSIVAGIAVRYAPELMPSALKRWEEDALK